MTMIKYTPFEFAPAFQAMEETLNRILAAPSVRPWTPAVDVHETENELVMTADLPAVQMKDIEIKLEDGTLTLKGERRVEKEESNRSYHRLERSFGSFARSFTLPDSIDAEKVTASLKDGVLTITLPKKEIARPRTIQVQVVHN